MTKGWGGAVTIDRDGDIRLFARVKARDLGAFEALYRSYHPRLTTFLSRMVRRPHLVEEVVNDTMMVVWSRPDSFAGASRLSTWIFAIAYRTAMKALRRQDEAVEPRPADAEAGSDEAADDAMGRQRVHAALRAAIDTLPQEQRTVVDLTYFHDMGYREIAEILDCPVGTVKTRMFHARRQLRPLFAGALGDWL